MTATSVVKTMEIKIQDAFIRTSVILDLIDKEIDAHSSTDFDVVSALVNAVRNEIVFIEEKLLPEDNTINNVST